jgi:phosphatidylserine/phosphatidylglycerophosphate/cardiolipin synthase-like enzyme
LTANPSKEIVIDYSKSSLPSNDTLLIINENHYQEVIERICAAKSSVKIMTANFKRFRLKPTGSQGENYNDGTPFIKYLMAKAIQGVSVQVICSMPSSSFRGEWKEFYQQINPKLFEYMFCERNHAKVVIVDDQMAYVGSANITPAGIGQGVFTPGNFEVGILTKNPEIVSSVTTLFYTIWNKAHCDKCHRADMCNAKNL